MTDTISLLNLSVTILILLLVTWIYQVIKVRRLKQFMVRHAQAIGYTLHQHPYCWLGSQMYKQFIRQYRLHGDVQHHYKNQLSKADLIISNIFFSVMIQLIHPELVKEFYLKANQGFYQKCDYGLRHLRRLIGTENLLLSEGGYWKSRRKILSTVFNFDFITSQIPEIQRITQRTLENLQKNYTNAQDKTQVKCDIVEPLLYVFSTVILKCFFKGDALERVGKQKTIDFITRVLLRIIDVGRSTAGVILGVGFAKLGLTHKNRQINRQVAQFRAVARQIVQKRILQIKQQQKNNIADQKNKKSFDIIEALIANKEITVTGQKGNQSKQSINIDEVINQFVTFFLAGSETTLAFTRMMIYRLAWHPDILQKVREEFQREVGNGQLTLHNLKNLKYFDKVQKQVLRMDSSVSAIFMRRATKDHYLGKLQIWKGSVVNIRIRAIHFKQSEYPSPNQFNPERWTEESSSNAYSYIPFSAGSRNCIGQHLALIENKIFMIELLKRYKNIAVSKGEKETKFLLEGLYGPQKMTTTLTKRS